MIPYLTPEEAKTLIRSCAGEAAAKAFEARSVEDQAAALFAAQLLIDGQAYKGQKRDRKQTEAFPRVIAGEDVGIPEAVRLALVLLVAETLQNGEAAAVKQLAAAGLTSYHLDDFSVSFGDRLYAQLERHGGLPDAVWRLLLPYLLIGGKCNVPGY